ncbi:prepilin-type N-terminal cleavage/methylation domain-containing protein [Salinibacterium sp. ZJ77]|uniref:type IV pilus modification PilV family protein n=1 Tax=Salinibacterium sp. ZJ77 TaxID=2708337 RepID=UPI00142168F1|nr:prepilin-type N-terminal cleavage/methylation domain-containing protein [Salinibacterium sp. ZJ77]
MRTTRPRFSRSDAGFSLLEVIVSLLILSIVVTASISFIIRANVSSAYQQHNQVAVTVAGQAMERVIATHPEQLVDDRSQTIVEAAFAANAAVGGVSQMYPLWDNAAGPTPLIPVTETQTFSGTEYTTTTLIGKCFRERATTVDVSCSTLPGVTSGTAATPAGHLALYRAVVVVRWIADSECPGGCTYRTSALIDATSGDPEWVG